MISELNLCNWCGMSEQSCGDEACPQRTRAVPDVPELEALKKYTVISPFAPIGEYVLHSQAAEIIAEKDAVIDGLREAIENTDCPRPCNGRPDDTTVKQCISYGECACVYGPALKGESNV